jgi:biotin transport system ATP-binding protein
MISPAAPAITVSHIGKKFFSPPNLALDDISFTLQETSCTVIAGANGSGKSLLMSIIAGLVLPTTGSTMVSGRVGLIFQDADTQILGETPTEDVAFGLKNTGLRGKKHESQLQIRVAAALEKVGLAEKATYPARFLSGGEKRRLAVAGILALDCPIIIFDEPYANLDFPGVCQVNNSISMLKADGRTIVILTHELEKCLALADTFLVLYQGKLVYKGTPAAGLTEDLSRWGVRNPLQAYSRYEDLLWNA